MVFFNSSLPASERACSMKNGATRRELVIINKFGRELVENEAVDACLGKLEKTNASFLFVNPGHEDRVLGVFVCSGYGYSVIGQCPDLYRNGDKSVPENTTGDRRPALSSELAGEVWTASSVGGYGNSESRIGIYEVGVLLYSHTYKDRTAGNYFRLTQVGWVSVPAHEVEGVEQEKI